jgi:superfamily II DNA or RNA helicase
VGQSLRLRPYQDDAADFLYERDRAMILAPVGAGKTAITLTAMQAMLNDGLVKRWLVVAPKRVCTDVWPVEAPKWSSITPALAVGTPAQRKAALDSGAAVVVINYDNLDKLEDLSGFDGVVFDELTRLKNPSGKRFKALEKLMSTMAIRWGLTGSFTSNGLEDVFGQCKIIDQGLLGRAKGAFLQQYFHCVNRDFGQWTPAPGALEQVMERIKPATFVLDPGD